MFSHWQSLIANLAVVALFISAWVHGQFIFSGRPRWVRNVAFGLTMGVGAVASMLLAIQIGSGTLFDLRSSLVAISAFFGGPIAALVTVAVAIAYRVALGGPSAIPGSIGILAMAGIGLMVSRVTRRRVPAIGSLGILATSVAVVSLGLSALWLTSHVELIVELTLPVALMNMAATALSAFFIMRNRVVERERDLLHAAFVNSPDLQYVKGVDSRFVAANLGLARATGFERPEQLVGKTDFDISPRDMAERSLADDRLLIGNGSSLTDKEEMLVHPNGEKSWYLTSKVALRDAEGRLIGLAGVTRDVTVRRKLRDEAEEARNRLAFVLAGVSDGIAMFDRFGVLVYCNDRYSQAFALTSQLRQPGRHIHEILRAVAETGEQKGIPAGLEAEWIEEVATTLDAPGEQDIQLFDGRWLQIKTRPAEDGAALVVVSDVTTSKQAETALRQMTAQLQRLATTDGLTGLVNRRAFDAALAEEMSRAQRTGLALSLLMIDVDRFKSYNDIYGHPAGDEVLKTIGLCLKGTVRRPGDVVARYGGEEFVVILPNTDEAGARFIAEQFREGLQSLGLPHNGNDAGVVTASVGIGTLCAAEATHADLVGRADQALYAAKAGGRNRVSARQPTPERKQA